MFCFKLYCVDETIITSPPIAPNNPNHSYNDKSIWKDIHRFCAGLVKRDKSVLRYSIITIRD